MICQRLVNMINLTPQLRILVVEDNLGDYVLLEEYLHETGLDIKEVENVISVAEAKQILIEREFDLIFLDLSLPDSFGLQSLTDLHQITTHIPIVVLSGMGETQITTEAIVKGAQDYLIKGELDAKLLSKTIRYSIERKRNLEKIKQSNERYTLVSNATVGVVWDINFVSSEVLRSGDAFWRSHGYNEQDFTLAFDFWQQRVHPDDLEAVQQKITSHLVKKERKFWEHEYRFRKENGEYFYVHDRGSIIYNNDEQPIRMIGTMMDITERKISEELVRKSEHNYRQIFLNNPNPMWIHDAESGAFLEVNPAAMEHYGYGKEEFLALTLADVRLDELSGGTVLHQKKNKEKIMVEIISYPINYAGKQAMQTLINDVTEKLRTQQEKQVVQQTIERFRNASSLNQGLTDSLKCVREYIGWEYAEIWIPDYAHNNIHLQASQYAHGIAQAKTLPIASTIFQKDNHEAYTWHTIALASSPAFCVQLPSNQIQTVVSLPILYNNKIVSWLMLATEQLSEVDFKIINFMEGLCKQLGSEIEKRNADEQLNHFFMLSSDLLGIATLDGHFVRVNNAFSRVLGYEPQEIYSRPLIDFVYEEDLFATQKVIQELSTKQTMSYMENRFVAKDGSIKWLSWSTTFLPDEKLVFASGRDVTRQKEEELQLRLLESVIINSNDAIVITEPTLDAAPKVVYFNPAFLSLTGYEQHEVVGNPARLLQGENTSLAELEKIDLALATWTEQEVELISYRKNGEEFWASLAVIPVPDKTGAFTHWISIFRDVTLRKKNEAEREMLIKELTDNNTDLKQFTFITSHNLRAPLSNLLGILELIDTSSIPDEMTRFLFDKFRESSNQLNQTVSDLLNVLVIKNKVNLEKKTLCISKEFESVVSSIRYQIREANASLDLNFNAIDEVSFDASYLQSILLNLLTNAIKYRSPKRPLQISVFTQETPDYIELHFSDNGIGIDMKRHHSKIFGLYQRFHDYPDSKGLGLYIVSSQIRALGGKIEVRSEVDLGTTFIAYFAK